MTSLEKAINLGYLFLTFKPKKNINTCTTFFCMYWYVSIYSEDCFWPQYMYPKLSPNNTNRLCPLGKLSHLGLEQLCTIKYMSGPNKLWQCTTIVVAQKDMDDTTYLLCGKHCHKQQENDTYVATTTVDIDVDPTTPAPPDTSSLLLTFSFPLPSFSSFELTCWN